MDILKGKLQITFVSLFLFNILFINSSFSRDISLSDIQHPGSGTFIIDISNGLASLNDVKSFALSNRHLSESTSGRNISKAEEISYMIWIKKSGEEVTFLRRDYNYKRMSSKKGYDEILNGRKTLINDFWGYPKRCPVDIEDGKAKIILPAGEYEIFAEYKVKQRHRWALWEAKQKIKTITIKAKTTQVLKIWDTGVLDFRYSLKEGD